MGARRKPGPDGTEIATRPNVRSVWSAAPLLGWVKAQSDRAEEAVNSFGAAAYVTGKSKLLEILVAATKSKPGR